MPSAGWWFVFFLKVLEARDVILRHLVRVCLLVADYQPRPVSSLGGNRASESFLIRSLIPFMRDLFTLPNHLPQALLPYNTILRVRILTHGFWRDATIQSVARVFTE
jgi:hypothetical protein